MKNKIVELKKYCDKLVQFVNDDDSELDRGCRMAYRDVSNKLKELLLDPNAFVNVIDAFEPSVDQCNEALTEYRNRVMLVRDTNYYFGRCDKFTNALKNLDPRDLKSLYMIISKAQK